MSEQHTPGPWTFGHLGSDRLWVGPDHDSDPVASVAWDCIRARDEARENARLIAAAPDMLTVLREISEIDAKYCSSLNVDTIMRVRAAIAKATGAA